MINGKISAFSHIENVFYFCSMQDSNQNDNKTKQPQKVAKQLPQKVPQTVAEQLAPKKKGRNKLKGTEGVRFSKTYQPTPEAKRAGWQEIRAQRHLTQGIIKLMIGDDGQPTETFKDYLKALLTNAKLGNAKAIEAVNKIMEDDILKIAQVDTQGNDKPNVNFNLVITPPSE